jgi:hypothetical protein
MRTEVYLRLLVVALGLSASALLPALADAATGCDRQCLVGIAQAYAVALVNHAPATLPTARAVKFTENLVPLRFGKDGLWRTVNGRRDFNIYAVDAEKSTVVWIGIVLENDAAVMLAARLKVEGRRLTEVETLVGRSALTGAAKVAGPRPDFAQAIAPTERLDRERLIAIAVSNWDAMESGDGHRAPYAVDCERYDNGEKTSAGESPAKGAADSGGDPKDRSCFGQMNSGRFNNGNRVTPRRIWAVDRDFGLVVGLFTPNVPGDAHDIHLRNGTTLHVDATELVPFTIEQVEMFKVTHGEISKVEVVLGPRVPYGMRSPFDMQTLWQER